ncbi:MAG TPA: small multi-drug export protein [Bacillota bacterium]
MQVTLSFDQFLTVLLASALPVSELRGAIPLALCFGAHPLEAYAICVFGNLLPVIPIMMVLPLIAKWAQYLPFFQKLFAWINRRTEKQQKEVNKYGFIGLTLFVAVPLPMTGVWTGATVAYFLGIRKRYAFFALMLGVILAGALVTLAAGGFIHLWR